MVQTEGSCTIRTEHRTVYGIRPYPYGANTVTGTPVTVTVQWPGKFDTVRYGCNYSHITGDTGSYGCDFKIFVTIEQKTIDCITVMQKAKACVCTRERDNETMRQEGESKRETGGTL